MRVALLALLTALCAFSQRLEFQVASIKPSPGTDQRGFYTDVRGGRLSVRNMTLFNLIQTAYRINDLQLPDVPGWITSARYDIDAQPSASFVATQDQLYDMLQSLLEDRFQFKFHKVTREQSGYALTVDDRGPKLAPAGEGKSSTLRLGNVEAPNINMSLLLSLLKFELDRPVMDRTGITTNFAIHLEWASRKIPSDADTSKPSLATALREQLGLKLESTKAPLEVFIIDHIEQPSEN